jgi:Predicted enzyme related to lactoylglutathione lyase
VARDFYGSVFQWHAEDMPVAGFNYTVVSTADGGEDTSIGGIMPLLAEQQSAGVGPYWLPYLEVEDVDTVVNRAQQLGGQVVMPAADMEGVGRMAQLTDPDGAAFSVINSAAS